MSAARLGDASRAWASRAPAEQPRTRSAERRRRGLSSIARYCHRTRRRSAKFTCDDVPVSTVSEEKDEPVPALPPSAVRTHVDVGANPLVDGANPLVDGANPLVDGANLLDDGATLFIDGADPLDSSETGMDCSGLIADLLDEERMIGSGARSFTALRPRSIGSPSNSRDKSRRGPSFCTCNRRR